MKIKVLYLTFTPVSDTLSNVAARDECGQLRAELTYTCFGELVEFVQMCFEHAERVEAGEPNENV